MFWTLLLRYLLSSSSKAGTKRLSQRSRLASWLLLYGIAKEFTFNLALLAMLWPWDIGILDSADGLTVDMLTPTGCITTGG